MNNEKYFSGRLRKETHLSFVIWSVCYFKRIQKIKKGTYNRITFCNTKYFLVMQINFFFLKKLEDFNLI